MKAKRTAMSRKSPNSSKSNKMIRIRAKASNKISINKSKLVSRQRNGF